MILSLCCLLRLDPGTPGAQPVLTGREGGIKETDLTIELVQMHWQQFQVRLRMI